jgi:hypothetical protein
MPSRHDAGEAMVPVYNEVTVNRGFVRWTVGSEYAPWVKPWSEILPSAVCKSTTYYGDCLITTTPPGPLHGTDVKLAITPVALVVLMFSGLGWVGFAITKAAKAHGHCPTCGYDLRATPDRCPECGTAHVPSSG